MTEQTCNRLMKTGMIGAILAAICCFTPVLVILLGLVGLSTVVGYLDYVLIPALGAFVILAAYAVIKKRQLACSDIPKEV
ncbi:MAG TPA: mercury resistance system transport protein MerF [Candidatus Limnocylindrales bacterium]|nr:mercury resistance system transport protein MerF [Candidatus Limnocylindrales bacterium]